MAADSLAPHVQDLYIVCGTAIPVLFVAQAIQASSDGRTVPVQMVVGFPPPFSGVISFEVPVNAQRFGLSVMLVGEIASLAALLIDWSSLVPQLVTVAGVLAGALFVSATVAPAPGESALGDGVQKT